VNRTAPARRHGPLRWGFLAAYALVILSLTLIPADAQGGVEPFSVSLRLTGFRALSDSLANIALFAPLGAAAALCMPGWVRPVIAGAALSLAIETTQLFIPGRYTSPWDLAFNTVGTGLGVALVRHACVWVRPTGALRAVLPLAALAAAALVLLAGPRLFEPAPVAGPLVGQWTHAFDGRPRYEGRILEARVGTVPVYAWPVDDSNAVRAALFRDTVLVRVLAGDRPERAVPLFAVVAPNSQSLLDIAIRGDDVIVGYRMRSRPLGLDQPDVRAHGALAGIAPGDTTIVRFWREPDGANCIAVDTTRYCKPAFGALDTWALILYPLPAPLGAVMPILWLAALLAPIAFWTRCPGPPAARPGPGR
jgi:VanZ family protein